MPDLYLLHEDYELRKVENGVATFLNVETGDEIEGSIRVNLNDRVMRIELGPPVPRRCPIENADR